MNPESIEGKTRLTEQQARALAHWWGGVYLRESLPAGGGPVHKVVIEARDEEEREALNPGLISICSLEEALNLEYRRGVINPGAPDWVG